MQSGRGRQTTMAYRTRGSVTDILRKFVVYGTTWKDVAVRLHESKQTATLPHRGIEAAFEIDAAKESAYIAGKLGHNVEKKLITLCRDCCHHRIRSK
jgi:hypothetical protein